MTSIPKPNIRSSTPHPSHLPPTYPPPQPLPASLLLSQDPRFSRLLIHDHNDFFSTGCRELDSHVLLNGGLNGGDLGGFEGGCVVGISSEEEETIGLAIGLQVIARMLLLSSGTDDDDVVASTANAKAKGEATGKGKAMIITTLSTTSLLPRLRLAVVSEARVLQGNSNAQQVDRGVIKSCLERVLVARVFDAEGLREVLRELEVEQTATHTASDSVGKGDGNEGGGEREGGGTGEKTDSKDGLPDLILITNTSHLLNTLFTRNKTGSDRFSAHNSAVQLSDQIRAIGRRGPLVMLLNSTSSPTSSSSFNSNSISMFDDNKGPKQPDLSIMRSIFNPPPPAPMEAAPGYMAGLVGHPVIPPSVGRTYGHRSQIPPQAQSQAQTQSAAAAAAASRRNKPSYGMVFSQMLDLHLLCTKVPRGRTRHGGGYRGGYGGYGGYVWAVEVLLDELGVYEGSEGVLAGEGGGEGKGEQQEEAKGRRGLMRRSREQRWGAVEIEEGSGRVVDAFR